MAVKQCAAAIGFHRPSSCRCLDPLLDPSAPLATPPCADPSFLLSGRPHLTPRGPLPGSHPSAPSYQCRPTQVETWPRGYRIHAPVSRTGRSVAPTSSAGIDFPSWDTSPTVSDQLVGCDELPEALASRIWRTACHTVSSLGMRRPDALRAGWGGPWAMEVRGTNVPLRICVT